MDYRNCNAFIDYKLSPPGRPELKCCIHFPLNQNPVFQTEKSQSSGPPPNILSPPLKHSGVMSTIHKQVVEAAKEEWRRWKAKLTLGIQSREGDHTRMSFQRPQPAETVTNGHGKLRCASRKRRPRSTSMPTSCSEKHGNTSNSAHGNPPEGPNINLKI